MHSGELIEDKKFKEDLKRGIPIEIRGEVWIAMIGNHLRVSPILYESLLAKVKLAEKNPDNDPTFKKNMKIVDVDLHRTFTDLAHFRSGEIFH